MTTVEHLPRADDVADSPVDEVRPRLEALYREHGERVLAICVFILRDRHEAEDAAQQVFVSALRALLRGAEPSDPGAWLATIARNESSARAGRRPTLALNTELRDGTQEDPATVVVRRDELARVWKAIEGLPASQRDALLLREMRGLAYNELVTALQLSHPSVRSLLNRARRTLRSRLEQGAAFGAPWVNVFTRVFGDTSTPALSSATRTAAVGLGALALTGGAAVVPSPTGHVHQRPAPHASRLAMASSTPASRGARAVDAAPVEESVRESQESLGLRDDHRSRRGSTDGGHRGSDGVSGSGRSADDGSTSGSGSSSVTSLESGGGGGSGSSGSDGGSGDTSISGDQATAVTSGGGGSSDGSGSGLDGASSGTTSSSTSGSDGGVGSLSTGDGSSSSSSPDGGSDGSGSSGS